MIKLNEDFYMGWKKLWNGIAGIVSLFFEVNSFLRIIIARLAKDIFVSLRKRNI